MSTVLRTVMFTSMLVGCIDDADPEIEVETSSTEQDITLDFCQHQTDFMPSTIPWSAQQGWSDAFCLNHEVDNVWHKEVTTMSLADFPQYTGAYTAAKYSNCQNSYVKITLYKRSSSSESWTKFAYYYNYAVPNLVWNPATGMTIDSCYATSGLADCDAIYFGTSSQFDVITTFHSADGDNSATNLVNVVSQPEINLANCN